MNEKETETVVDTILSAREELNSHRTPRNDSKDEKEDPFLILGFGLITYRVTLRVLTLFFFIASIIVSPIIYIYSNGGGININQNLHSNYG